MTSCVKIVALLVLLSACASPSGAARTFIDPAPAPLPGTWVGSMWGPDMATALGNNEAPARLTLAEDGRWTLTSSGGTVATDGARHRGTSLVLDGTVTAGDPMAVGRSVSFVLRPRGPGAMYGDGQSFYLGHRIDAGIALRRVS